MGTSTMGSDLHSDKQDKLVKLQARKKELEQMLAAKNEELYRLCVQEVQLTGVMPPEAPLSPDAPRERAASVRSDGTDAPDGADARRRRHPAHRLSTPARRADAGCANFFPSPPHERADTFSLHSAHAPARAARPAHPAHPARPRDAHFSSSHPDIAHYAPPAPLLYQYAAQLKAHSRHLAPHHHHQPPLARRRTALTRTQTYHLTSHSDYSQHLDAMTPPPPVLRPAPAPATLPLRERARPLLVAADADAGACSPLALADGRGREKQWYETALDAPARAEAPRRGAGLRRTPSAGAAQTYEVMVSSGRHSALQSPSSARSPPVLSPGAVSLESPKNMTVIEQGKCIPYREETKPFEMSDFYKYSTKFRHASAPKPAAALPGAPAGARCPRLPVELPPHGPEQWHSCGN
ncbi:translation initiation factor IF-2 [Bicyclus anynana]|uniref:Translation initiation factor IF-2 n=1 Tax=Bicyclus anynana TaxID=110368 RepID=A0ABM3LZ74_BICAN|nr:translation initiation factor IF-2 [Bicyclus anynana]